MLERMPMRAREATVVGPPLFHGTGLLIALLSIGLGSKLVLRRRFDAAQFLDDIEAHQATAVCVVPIMLQRILALGDDEIRARDLVAAGRVLRRISAARRGRDQRDGRARGRDLQPLRLHRGLARDPRHPADVRAAPTSVGKPLLGSRVRILDEHGREPTPGRDRPDLRRHALAV